ncbi:putative bifunctional diguanylate cyclase/phosphodiesterase [Shinella zoogloeoides]|uniref:EAL domain-containing protein n=1 Tax=Shinella zoogloeoides TaxID=352475 RepID=A0A6N8TEP1_SHIZO|nr:bifunctional diguanylate cyclase/phosphodiesterase [Shinella zoogloeoides]MXN99589.1 EAL domain-containing protein [Shinella zoogloeoides]UEX82637.1 bifunctional diguanylate cyclase/phosphodiesterase [Shinella zoogloeoides]
MTLGKRALSLIFPVVLAGYVLAASLIYYVQSASIIGLERARLWQQMGLLTAVFQNEATQNRSFIYSLVEGGAVRLFVNEPDAAYRNTALGVRLQQSITSLSDDRKRFISVAIIRPPLTVDYYFEDSDDPFAEITPQQIAHAKQVIDSPRLSSWSYLDVSGIEPLIVHSEFIDPLTFNRPVASAKNGAILVQTAVRPKAFIDMKRALEKEYGATIEIGQHQYLARGALSATATLGPSLFARLTPDPAFLAGRLSTLKTLLALGAVALSLCTIGLVLLLVRRYITNPIARLDRQLTDVMTGSRSALPEMSEAGEIGRLSVNVKRLHDHSMQSFDLVQNASWTDTLTGISNREYFNIRSTQILGEAEAEGIGCTLLFIDVDNFKFVNDKHGHKIGDELLKTLADRISAIVERIVSGRGLPQGLFARLSGDEFAIMLRCQPGSGAITEISSEILALFAEGFEVLDKAYPVTASIGIAVYPEDARTLAELVANADAAMYQAKSQGKNGSARYSRSLHETRNRQRRIEEELRVLDPDEEFHLVYMPIVDGHGKVTGCEALLRWTSPLIGNVTPDEFIPIAETTGLFSKIDWWVIDRAMAEYGQIKKLFGADTVLCINISSAELYTKSISDHFCDCADRHGVDARMIEIELTETFAVKLGEQSRRNIEILRGRGFRISIDDFGAGYTSVQQIIEYPAETIKLDRALVESLTRSAALPTLRALVALCHAQDMSVIAEGVDTTEKMALLAAAGCDLYQGYLISRPLALDDLGVWAMQRLMEKARENAQSPERRARA